MPDFNVVFINNQLRLGFAASVFNFKVFRQQIVDCRQLQWNLRRLFPTRDFFLTNIGNLVFAVVEMQLTVRRLAFTDIPNTQVFWCQLRQYVVNSLSIKGFVIVRRRYRMFGGNVLHCRGQIRHITEFIGLFQEAELVIQAGFDFAEIFLINAFFTNQVDVLHYNRHNSFAVLHTCIS